MAEEQELQKLRTYYSGLADPDVAAAYSWGPDGFREPEIWEIVRAEYAHRVATGALSSGDFIGGSARAAAHWVIEELRRSFPSFKIEVQDPPSEGLEVEVDIPVQPGLLFGVGLSLQNDDELYLAAAGLCVSWYPCTDSVVAEGYLEAVRGLLSGEFRIAQHRRADRLVGAELQRPSATGWETVTRCHYAPPISGIWWPFSQKSLTIAQNGPAA